MYVNRLNKCNMLSAFTRSREWKVMRQVFWLARFPEVPSRPGLSGQWLEDPGKHRAAGEAGGGFTATGIAPDLHRIPY